ncbi:MAG TPA: BRO family protein, partial [Desulfovibrio sp.]|uniref:BRO-N domain-containing protein n=1 Tax=Desulfovibrio sp. TaxID=885 RepID=UPI002D3D602D
MNALKIFEHEAFGSVRAIERGGQPWFAAKDVAHALGYTSTNMATVFQAVPAEWKGSNPIATHGGTQELLMVAEPGLYFFLGRSDKPGALPFQKWLAGEVLPSIRRHGIYATPQAIEAMLGDPDTTIKILTA